MSTRIGNASVSIHEAYTKMGCWRVHVSEDRTYEQTTPPDLAGLSPEEAIAFGAAVTALGQEAAARARRHANDPKVCHAGHGRNERCRRCPGITQCIHGALVHHESGEFCVPCLEAEAEARNLKGEK